MTDPVVVAHRLSKSYGAHVVVDAVDFAIPRGKCYGFLGPNGAGKTTTLRLLLGLTPKSGGELEAFGLPVAAHAAQIRRRIGVVPQSDNLDPDFTVAENLRVYASYFALRGEGLDARIDELLEFVALGDRSDARTHTLSGGMQRRLTIARALINEPELVVLDEPTTGLDPQARHVIWGRLAELRASGTTLILTTHYMEEAERLCDELVIMDNGRVLARGSPATLIADHVEPEVIEIRGENSIARCDPLNCRTERMGSSLYCYTRDPAPLLAALHDTHAQFIHRPSGLEDVFLKLTGRELRD
ncbi:MAG: ATP-binding cassette domain-containing protein [Gammaproteobacteria bacterium]|nr:ATP-binding cassette domain-containing protein [Gammaproteobacteria bacterium]